jgi:histidinol-phosphate aminotransferase
MNQIVLDRNENQYGPAPACYKVLQQANLEQLSLYSRDYALGRKSELSFRLSKEIGIPENRLLLSYGSEDMLKQVVHCYLNGSKTMLLPRQSWWYYKALASEVHGKQVEYSLREQANRFVYDLDEMISLYDTHHPQLILIASPNNPTGSSMPQEDLAALIDHCSTSVIVLDEAYYGFAGESNNYLKSLLDSHKRLIVLRTFSKYYALAGLRIGYACVGEELTDLIAFSARYLGYNQLTEKIALAALDSSAYYKTISERICNDKERYFAELSMLEGFIPFHSDANFILVRYPAQHKKQLKQELLERGITVKFLDDPGLEDCIRITIGTQEQDALVISAFKDIAIQVLRVPTLTTQPSLVK